MDEAVKLHPAKRILLLVFFCFMTVLDDFIHWVTHKLNWGFGEKEYAFCWWSQNNFAQLNYAPKINICPTCEDVTEIETWNDKYGRFFRCRTCGEEFDFFTGKHVRAIDKIRQEKE